MPEQTLLLQKEIDAIVSYLPSIDKINQQVSKVNIGWHLDHSLNVILSVHKAVSNSNPAEFKSSFNLTRTLILTTGIIPRGKARAPKVVQSNVTEFKEEDLLKKIKQAKSCLVDLLEADNNAHFRHPYFGDLNKKNTGRFLEVHTRHHLKIVKDILKT